ncbi:MAG: carboxypeptidase regulatory-like domain-containing protein [Symploca sp. SIO3E6]|nr:carboxypeptidase regulatory-like domain-containing protein [Caldora sp. SIO3E6]
MPGLLLRGRYEEVSVTTGQASYSIELLTSINLQQGIAPGERQSDRFRSRGGVLIQPFFDRNNNGKRDNGEDTYTENPELLLILNNQPFKSFRPEIQTNRILVRLPPATYRLDLDPSGFPLDWQATVDAYAIEVVAGSYTIVSVPLIPSYTLSGVVTDVAGNPIAGARVEAITSEATQRRFSVTNGAGVYYLERLPQGSFTLQINGEPAQPNTIFLDESSEPFQELNLQPSS